MFEQVFEFNEFVIGIPRRPGEPLGGNEIIWLTGCLNEEAEELREARDRVDQVDALVDSIIFAMGGLYRLGLSERQAEDCFNAVMSANFEKKLGQKEGRRFEGVADAVKPEGWVGPEDRIRQILEETPA